MCKISSGRSCNFLRSWIGLDAELQLEWFGDFTMLSWREIPFGGTWLHVWYVFQVLLNVFASLCRFMQLLSATILAKEMDCWMRIARSSMAKQRRRLCGAQLPKCFFHGRDVCNGRQCVKMVEMWCCQSQLLRWVLVGGHWWNDHGSKNYWTLKTPAKPVAYWLWDGQMVWRQVMLYPCRKCPLPLNN